MSNKNNKICIICNTPYHYCPTCGEDASKPSWYSIFDTPNCHKIYEICTSVRDGIMSNKEACSQLDSCNLDKLEQFNNTTKRQVKEILEIKNSEKNEKPVVVSENEKETKKVNYKKFK